MLRMCPSPPHLFPLSDRPQAHSDESRLSNLLRRVSREDDRDRRLATLKQMRDLIVHSENKVVSFGTQHKSVPASEMVFTAESFDVFWLILHSVDDLLILSDCLFQVLVKQLDTILSTLNDILNERCVCVRLYLFIYLFIFIFFTLWKIIEQIFFIWNINMKDHGCVVLKCMVVAVFVLCKLLHNDTQLIVAFCCFFFPPLEQTKKRI